MITDIDEANQRIYELEASIEELGSIRNMEIEDREEDIKSIEETVIDLENRNEILEELIRSIKFEINVVI